MSFKVPGRLLTDGQCRMMINGIQFIQVLLEANGLAAGVAAITVICYLAATAVKQTPLANKWLPTICGTLGGVLGVLAWCGSVPDFPAGDPLTALAVGIVSGLAATGTNQLIRQLKQPE